jgi:hypothetical protein
VLVWSLAVFLEWEIFQTQVAEKIKTHFMINNFFPKIVPFVRYNSNALFSSTQLSDTSYGKDNCVNTNKLNKKFRAEFRYYFHVARFCYLAYLKFLLLLLHSKFVKNLLLKFLLCMRRHVDSFGQATSVLPTVDKYSSDLSDLSPYQNICA